MYTCIQVVHVHVHVYRYTCDMTMESLSAYHFAAVNATYKSAAHAYYEIKIYMCMYDVIEWRCIIHN